MKEFLQCHPSFPISLLHSEGRLRFGVSSVLVQHRSFSSFSLRILRIFLQKLLPNFFWDLSWNSFCGNPLAQTLQPSAASDPRAFPNISVLSIRSNEQVNTRLTQIANHDDSLIENRAPNRHYSADRLLTGHRPIIASLPILSERFLQSRSNALLLSPFFFWPLRWLHWTPFTSFPAEGIGHWINLHCTTSLVGSPKVVHKSGVYKLLSRRLYKWSPTIASPSLHQNNSWTVSSESLAWSMIIIFIVYPFLGV